MEKIINHELNNHLMLINEMLKQNKIEEAKEYINIVLEKK